MEPALVLFGRDQELATLGRLLGARRAGCMVVAGEAGIGKSRLVQAAAPDRGLVAVGSATRPPSPALRPLVEIAVDVIGRGASPDAASLALHRRALATLLPGLIENGSTGSTGLSRPEDDIAHPVVLADALVRLLDLLPRPARPAMLIEDLQWADEATLAVVEALADRADRDAGTLVLTVRPEGAPWEAALRLVQRRVATLIELGPLAPGDVLRLAAHRLGVSGVDLPAGLADAVAPAEGRPLLIEEIVQAALSDGTLHRDDDGGWAFSASTQIVPRSLTATVARRLDELGAARAVVEHAAVLGRDFPAEILVTALGDADVFDAVRVATRSGLLESGPGGAPRFRHELLREAVLAGMVDAQRRAAAGRLLRALDGTDGERSALGAALALQAGEDRQAAELLVRAAEWDLARGVPGVAASSLDRALRVAEPDQRLAVRELRVHARALAGDVDGALADAAEVDVELPDTGDPAAGFPETDARRRRLGEAVIRAIIVQGRLRQADELVTGLRRRFPEAAATASLAALVALERGRYAEAEAAARAALAAAQDDVTARCQAMEVLGRLARRRDLAEAQRWFRRAVGAAEQGGLAVWRARALHELATIAQLATLDVEALRVARTAAVDAAAPALVAAIDLHIAAVCGVRFEAGAALATAREMLDTARRLGAHGQEAFAWILIGQAHAVAGDATRAEVAAAQALGLAGTEPEIVALAWAPCRGLPALLEDDLVAGAAHWQRAVAAARELPSVTPQPPWYLWGVLATALDLEGDGGERARRETSAPELRVATGADALWHLADAVHLGRTGDPDAAQAAAETSDELFARVPAFAGYRHLGRRIAASAALADGWGDPAGWMTEASDWASERGFAGLARGARSLTRLAGVKQRRSGRGDAIVPAHLAASGVTSREMDVLLLLADGLTNKQIAQRLYIAPRTVKGHVEALLAKTGTANRTQLTKRLNPATPAT